MALDPETIASLQGRIDAVPGQTRASPREVIAELLPAIDAARARGVPLDALLPLLRDAGVTLSSKTVRDYMCRARRASARVDSSSRSLPTPHLIAAPRGSRERVAAPLTASADHSAELPPGHFRVIPDTPDI